MKKLKCFFVLLLTATMLTALCACGRQSAPEVSGFRCVDDSGNAVEGVVLTVYDGESSTQYTTGPDGITEVEDTGAAYTATVFSVPDGYVFDDTEYSLEKGTFVDITIFVKTGPSDEELAAMHDAVAKARALMYPTDGTQLDPSAALAVLQEYADSDYPEFAEAAYLYGFIRYQGVESLHPEQDPELARVYLQRAADAGYIPGKAALGELYLCDTEFKDYGLGCALIDEAIAGGLPEMSSEELGPDGMLLLGDIYGGNLRLEQDYARSLEWYEKASDAGCAFGTYSVGYYYYKGLGVEKDWTAAKEWYEKAGDAGFGPGYSMLGDLYYYGGYGIEQDYAASMEWFEKGAALGHPYGMLSVGYNYGNGYGVEQDNAKAMEWYLQAAERGNASSLINLGTMYRNGKGVEQDNVKGFEYFQKAAELGEAAGYNGVAWAYYKGTGVETDPEKALQCFLKAENIYLGSNENNNEQLIYMLENNEGTRGEIVGYTYTYAYKAAADGDTDAMRELGDLFSDYYGLSPDIFETDYYAAYNWYKKAANAGDTTAMQRIAELYENGIAMTQNISMALKWYEKAYEAGDTDLAYDIAVIYEGILVPSSYTENTDYGKALEWYNKALENGDIYAYARIGILYKSGLGVEQDYEAAMSYYMKGYEAGDPTVAIYIGNMYAHGEGVEQSAEKAIEWYNRLDGDDIGLRDYLIGKMYLNSFEDKDTAIEYFQKAIAEGYSDPDLYDELGLEYSIG